MPETIPPQAGILLGGPDTDVTTPEYIALFAQKVQELATSDVLWRSCSFAGREHASMLDWSGVAEQWDADWQQRLAARVNDPWRLERHFRATGDLEALQAGEAA